MFDRNRKKKQLIFESFGQIKEDSFDFDLIEKYHKNKDNSNSFQVISDKTCNDIDFEELFMFLDRTNSKVGQQYLYNLLRVIPLKSNNHERDEILIKKITEEPALKANIQIQLDKLNKDEAYYISSLFQEEHLHPPKWYSIIPMLSFTSVLSLIGVFYNPTFIFILLGVFLINLIIHYWNKRNLYQYYGSIPYLLALNNIARRLFKNELFKGINPNLSKSIKIIDTIRNRMSFFKLDLKFNTNYEIVFWTILEFIKIIFLLEPLLLFSVLKQLNSKRQEIDDVFSFVGKIDSLLSIASLRTGLDSYCLPEILSESKNLKVNKVYHPLIVNCVENSIDVGNKSILLTGSNMSGKTSFIRTIGINTITGLTINTCFAEKFVMPKIRIYSAIRISDDLMNDKSYYFEEVSTIKNMIKCSEEGVSNLFLLDEIFKGTNTIERIAAGKAVLSYLLGKTNIVFVSTHDIELTELLKDEYELFHFSELVKDNSVDFDYKLKEGKLRNRNAIRILQLNEYPQEIINEAIKISNEINEVSKMVLE